MITPTLDPSFAAAIERELEAIGTKKSRLQQQRRARAAITITGAVALAGILTAAAIIAVNYPGTTTIGPLGNSVTATYTGTGIVDLGPAPDPTVVVIFDVDCRESTGWVEVQTVFALNEGATSASARMLCSSGKTMHVDNGLPPAAGTTSVTITADPETTWKATAQYGTSSTTPWGVNANGQTYGVPNDKNGSPDLTPALATNGNVGYIAEQDVLGTGIGFNGYINVYESDGMTVIGQFPIGDVGDQLSVVHE
jgi:hypothetical protein